MNIFKITDTISTFKLDRIGQYELLISGGFKYNNKGNFGIIITRHNTNEQIILREKYFKVNTVVNWKRAIEFMTFNIDKIGEFDIKFINIHDLEISKSRLFFKNLLFPSKLNIEEVEIIIK